MDISVAMCTYNGSKFLAEQLSSIREQTKLPHELVICDDDSTDATPRIVHAFALDAPFPVRFFRNQATLGSTRNFEKAINLCEGQAIALCDQDDIWQPNKLERLASVLDSEPQVGGVCSNAFLMDETSECFPDSLWERRNFTPRMQAAFQRNSALQLLQYNAATGATFAFRSEFVKQVTPIPPEWVHDAWIALLVATQSRVQLVPEKLISYRIHPAQQIGVEAQGHGLRRHACEALDGARGQAGYFTCRSDHQPVGAQAPQVSRDTRRLEARTLAWPCHLGQPHVAGIFSLCPGLVQLSARYSK